MTKLLLIEFITHLMMKISFLYTKIKKGERTGTKTIKIVNHLLCIRRKMFGFNLIELSRIVKILTLTGILFLFLNYYRLTYNTFIEHKRFHIELIILFNC